MNSLYCEPRSHCAWPCLIISLNCSSRRGPPVSAVVLIGKIHCDSREMQSIFLNMYLSGLCNCEDRINLGLNIKQNVKAVVQAEK